MPDGIAGVLPSGVFQRTGTDVGLSLHVSGAMVSDMNLSCPAEWVYESVTWAELRPIPLPLPVDSWWGFGIILVLLVLFVWAVVRLVSRETDDIDPAEVDRQMLTAINELHRRGDLSQEEFRSIKSQLVERLADRAAPDSADSITQRAQGTVGRTSDVKATELSSGGVTQIPTEQPRPALPDSEQPGHDDRAN